MDFTEYLFSLFGATVIKNESMKKHTTTATGGNCDFFVTVYCLKALRDVIDGCLEYGVDYKIIGNGTNLVFSDKGYNGVIISLKGLTAMRCENNLVYAMGGVSLCDLVLFSAEFGLYGAEPLVGIPATVGGATVMNAGAFGKTTADFINRVVTLKDGKTCYYEKEECQFGYRTSRFLGANEPIVSVTFEFEKGNYSKEDRQKIIDKCRNTRRGSQPLGKSCGSVFKNPPNDYAGRLIESVGLRGFSLGEVSVSSKHANFINVSKNATSTQVYNLVKYVQDKVYSEFGILLEQEVEFVGDF